MRERPTANPANRFASTSIEYDPGDGPRPSSITLLEDHSRSILSHNDSPDLGFSWSVNPYRGCVHACVYCTHPDTPILLGDGRTRTIAELKVGDEIYGTRFDGKYRRYVRTKVLDHWEVVKPAYRVTLADGTELVASGDHRFFTDRGWKHVLPAVTGQRPFLTPNNSLVGTGQFASPPLESAPYRAGYLCGMIRGDATLRRYDYSGRRNRRDVIHQFRLALIDLEGLRRTKAYLASFEVATAEFEFAAAVGNGKAMQAIRASSPAAYERITALVAWPAFAADSWHKGFLAGVFDAEGSYSGGILRIANGDEEMIRRTVASAKALGFDVVVDTQDRAPPMHYVRIRGGLRAHLRFFHTVDPAITRKRDIEGAAIKFKNDLRVVSIEPVGKQLLYDITTGTGDFIANGVVSHNCYARPTHEYLDMGAGTDFDTKIVYKPRAAELLRGAFDAAKWKGELVMFSGVTDCYQPFEAKLRLTRACLEVCLEYRNPVSVISKSALVERDIDLFQQLAAEADCHVSVSLAFIDAEAARAVEPWAPSPERRLKVIEAMARAGVPVGIMVAPIIPGLNDRDLPALLARAREAGASSAGWALLRLPGAVAPVFEERVRAAMPLRADKILARVRDTRSGKIYDSRFHVRGRGEGRYAETIAALFEATALRVGLKRRHRDAYDEGDNEDVPQTFRRPARRGPQLSLPLLGDE
jgi:DNA repair photolyase